MCKAMEEMRNEAARAADLAARRRVAASLLKTGKLSHEEIAACADLTLQEVKALAGEKGA